MVYDQSLFQELLKLREDVIFFSAEHSDRMIGGGWFFRDGNELLYWHGAMDYEYSRCFPLYAVINMAINLAWEERFLYFNMGSSLGSESLEQFKSFWGAKPKTCWQFEWRNPLWKALHLAWASLR
jgi:lipid II:glycine glycyltransferase (peptidoglycan interpeptide bridge formation enzyme)